MKFFKEFKAFISRGNVFDMAVGIIIGGAFTAIVTALTNQILMPIVNWILFLITGGKGMENVYTYLKRVEMTNDAGETVVDLANSIYIDWGAFITAIINFILIALVLFLIVRGINRARERAEAVKAAREAQAAAAETPVEPEPEPAPAPAETPEDILRDIRELLKAGAPAAAVTAAIAEPETAATEPEAKPAPKKRGRPRKNA